MARKDLPPARSLDRQILAAFGQETLKVLQDGEYQSSTGQTVSIRQAVDAACAGTRLYLPEEYPSLVAASDQWRRFPKTEIRVTDRTTLAAGSALSEEFPALACLNFASAKRPGGGFLNGSPAQEESLARSSALYAALQTQPEFYAFHRRRKSAFYSSRVIFSPGVPVFRDDEGHFLEQPWSTAFLTAAAVNAGSVSGRGQAQKAKIAAAMAERIRMVLAVAAHHRCDALVLGAWGCGVFRNDPAQIAGHFAEALGEMPFANCFRQIEFAIFDPTPDQTIITPFLKAFL